MFWCRSQGIDSSSAVLGERKNGCGGDDFGGSARRDYLASLGGAAAALVWRVMNSEVVEGKRTCLWIDWSANLCVFLEYCRKYYVSRSSGHRWSW